MNRTTRSFPTPPNFWPIAESWAIANGYRSVQSDGGTRVFQKGRGFWVAPMMLQLHEAGGTIEMAAWIHANLFVRICALMLLPAEMGIESGGFKAVLPRKIARKAVNQLLEQLAQPPIP